MLKIVAKLTVKEEMKDEFIAKAKELVAKSCAEEGNVSYSINVSTKDPLSFAFIEVWKDEEAIQIHNNSEHFTTIFPQIGQMTVGESSIDVFSEL